MLFISSTQIKIKYMYLLTVHNLIITAKLKMSHQKISIWVMFTLQKI